MEFLTETKRITLPPMVHFDEKRYAVNENYGEPDDFECEEFLKKFAECGIASKAAQFLGRSEVSFQAIRAKNKAFAAAWEWARRASLDILKNEARRRAVDGVVRPVWYQGEVVGEETHYSDALLMFLLKEHPDFTSSEEESEGRGTITSINVNVVPKGSFIDAAAAQRIKADAVDVEYETE